MQGGERETSGRCAPLGAGPVIGVKVGQHEDTIQQGLEAVGAVLVFKLKWKCITEKLVWWQEVCGVGSWKRLRKAMELGPELSAAIRARSNTWWASVGSSNYRTKNDAGEKRSW